MPHAQLHGDFKPDNILISDARTVGIDFNVAFHNATVVDLAHFANQLLLLTYEPGRLRWFSSRYLLVRAFVDGYARSGVDLPSPVLDWMRLHDLVRTWTKVVARGRSSVSTLYLGKAVVLEVARALANVEGAAAPSGHTPHPRLMPDNPLLPPTANG